MLPALANRSFNPLRCCGQTTEPDAVMPGWMRQFRDLAKAWVHDARTSRKPATWSEPYFEKRREPAVDPHTVLLDTLVPHIDSMEVGHTPTLLPLRSPQGHSAELIEFVGHLVRQRVQHLLVIGDVLAPGLQLNTAPQPRCQDIERGGVRASLTQSPARPIPAGWEATLEIRRGCVSPTVEEDPPLQLSVLHVTPNSPGLLDPDELRSITGWLSASGENATLAVTGEDQGKGNSKDMTQALYGMVGQLALSMAMRRRHPGRNPCLVRGGQLVDAPMREAMRELHRRHPGYIAGWRHLGAVASVQHDAADDRRVSRWFSASPLPEAPAATSDPPVAATPAPAGDNTATHLDLPLQWHANPFVAQMGWCNLALDDSDDSDDMGAPDLDVRPVSAPPGGPAPPAVGPQENESLPAPHALDGSAAPRRPMPRPRTGIPRPATAMTTQTKPPIPPRRSMQTSDA